MEIEVGEFVRTNKGIIDKVERYSLGCNVWHCKNGMCINECNVTGVYLKDIVKHSKHIIDLIEEGDYVNGYKTIELKKSNIKDDDICILVYRNHQYEQWETIFENEIKTILTHEQFEKNCYRLEEMI